MDGTICLRFARFPMQTSLRLSQTDRNTWAQIRALPQQGHSIRQIARGLDVARNAVREVLRSTAPSRYGPRLARASVVAPYRAYLANGRRSSAPMPGACTWSCSSWATPAPRSHEALAVSGEPRGREIVNGDAPERCPHVRLRYRKEYNGVRRSGCASSDHLTLTRLSQLIEWRPAGRVAWSAYGRAGQLRLELTGVNRSARSARRFGNQDTVHGQ
jgi:Helix-turn-helix domain of resolvase